MDARSEGTPAWAMNIMHERIKECLAKGKSDRLALDTIRVAAETTRTYQFYMRADQTNYEVKPPIKNKK